MQDYIGGLEVTETLPSIARLQAAKNTEAMPNPNLFAEKFEATRERLFNYESGSFIDIRKI